jgi:hypothetical protein
MFVVDLLSINLVILLLRENSFLAHLAKGNVSFCHHLASVVCRPLTFQILIFIFKKSANQKQDLPVVAMFVNGLGRNEKYL